MVRIHPEWQNSIQQEGHVNALTSQSAERIHPQGKTAYDRKGSNPCDQMSMHPTK